MISFKRTDAERTVAFWCRLWCRGGGGGGGRIRKFLTGRRRVVADVFQKSRRRHEEQIAGLRDAEIEQAVVISGRTADEHIFQHLLDGSPRTCVAAEIGAELLLADAAERHVVADDLDFLATLDDGRQRVM